MQTLRSDNNAGLCPEALQAIVDASEGHHVAYGDDAYTAAAVDEFRRIFGDRTSVWFVSTGTAANTLAMAALTRPWQQVLCHLHSHYNDDESTAPERITHCRTIQVRTDSSKLEPADVARVGVNTRGDVHQPQPGVVAVSNPTEFGTVYTPAELEALCEAAHAAGYQVHVDGARFANAVAALDCDPRALSVDAGVDALSFGGTKNGLAYGEAVLFFPQADGRAFEEAAATFAFHRKSTGHLLSKHRFISAPFAATLRDGTWLRHAAHANRAAARLAEGLRESGYHLRFPAEANAVFVTLPPEADRALRDRGHAYYPFGDRAWNLFRLMCSFDTPAAQIDAFLADARAVVAR
ncbi:MAG: threonine aldolase family protein [Planctomycetota bacterium]|jgi:threonine aldolase